MFFFFFFQAEDGIRDTSVTGVQTCALPILPPASAKRRRPKRRPSCTGGWRPSGAAKRLRASAPRPSRAPPRSEERRVGKEWRSRWAADHKKNKKSRVQDGEGDERCKK